MQLSPTIFAVTTVLFFSCKNNPSSQSISRMQQDSSAIYRESQLLPPVAPSPPPPGPPATFPLDKRSLQDYLRENQNLSAYMAPERALRIQQMAANITPEDIFLEMLRRTGALKNDTVPSPYMLYYPSAKVNATLQKLTTLGITQLPESDALYLCNIKGLRVRYGPDNREEVYYDPANLLLPNPDRKDMCSAKCVAAVIPRYLLDSLPDGTYMLKQWETLRTLHSLCPDEPFIDQQSAADCTAFLLNDSTLITAGHCLDSTTYHSYYFVFDYIIDEQKQPRIYFPRSSVFTAKSITRQYDGIDEAHPCLVKRDLCIVYLDRKADHRRMPVFSTQSAMSKTDIYYVIGCSAGLPLKLAGKAGILDNSSNEYFTINSDTYEGNSGSPVFNGRTDAIEGYFIRGCPDYDFKLDGIPCQVSVECPFKGKCPNGEIVIRTSQFLQILN